MLKKVRLQNYSYKPELYYTEWLKRRRLLKCYITLQWFSLFFGELNTPPNWVKFWKFHKWAKFALATKVYCHKPHQSICNGKKVKGVCYKKLLLSHLLFWDAILIKVVKNIFWRLIILLFNIDLQNGVSYYSSLFLGSWPSFENSIIEQSLSRSIKFIAVSRIKNICNDKKVS